MPCECTDTVSTESNNRVLDLPEGVPPLNAFYLYLTTGCNLACRHCWITPTFVRGKPSPGDCLDLSLLKLAVAEAKPLGLSQCKLTGGEPTLHPQFVEIVDFLTAEGLQLNMESNGTLIDAALAKHLKNNTNLGFISVSIDGARAETHDGFRNLPGSFDAVLRGLGHLVDAGYRPQVIMSPHRGNIRELDDVVKLAVERGAGSVKFNPVTRSGRGVAMHDHGETLDYDEVMALVRYVRGELQERTPVSLTVMVPPALATISELMNPQNGGDACHIRFILGILGNGEMALCGIGRNEPELVFGLLGQVRVQQVWLEHPVLVKLRQDLDGIYPGVCGECIHARRCLTHCAAQNYLDTGCLISPAELCAEADRRGRFPPSRRRNPIIAECWPAGTRSKVNFEDE
jgi:SynChlorMet cassette radical SAM/SPASM protein ScmF